MDDSPKRRRVLLLELNEITSTILDPLLARGRLPHFQRLRREGAWALPDSVERPPHLDPWVTWVTVHTGVDRRVHGATVLEQDAATINARSTWDYATEAGRSIGVFGSIGAHPPRQVPGFMVPGPFSPTSATFPAYLEPVQDLNRAYTQVHARNKGPEPFTAMLRRGLDVARLGLTARTAAIIAGQLARERVDAHARYRRVLLQPRVNYDVFAELYRRYRPDYATWHTNHAAHLMHHYWRAMDDSRFLAPSPPDEKRWYGGAVEEGYTLCDELLGRFMRLVDASTTLVVASSMGQQPYVAELFPEGRIVVRIRDMTRLLEILGARGVTGAEPMMVPQWNVTIPDGAERARVKRLFQLARAEGGTLPAAFSATEVGDTLTVSPLGQARRSAARYFFPEAPGARPEGYSIEELFAVDTETPKEGMHHPRGILGLWGPGIAPGVFLEGTTNLDIAPTLLWCLGVPVPEIMKGRVLVEAWRDPAQWSPGAAPSPRAVSDAPADLAQVA